MKRKDSMRMKYREMHKDGEKEEGHVKRKGTFLRRKHEEKGDCRMRNW